ncbi:MAG: efflux RND transporter periplasmic adaptor subunit [Chloroflexota bacterium]
MRSRSFTFVIIILIVAAVGVFYYMQQAAAKSGKFVLSGTIEVTETNLPTLSGGQVKQVYVKEGDAIRAGQPLVDVYSLASQVNESITSPIDGTVLERLVEPNEMAAPGGTVLVVAPLDTLYLKIYVPENRYGQIVLGQSFPVSVDSFPGQNFSGKVSFISNKAEFTPRNVQTTDSRQTTVYAIKLDLDSSGGKLKPGMPADVTFDIK